MGGLQTFSEVNMLMKFYILMFGLHHIPVGHFDESSACKIRTHLGEIMVHSVIEDSGDQPVRMIMWSTKLKQ